MSEAIMTNEDKTTIETFSFFVSPVCVYTYLVEFCFQRVFFHIFQSLYECFFLLLCVLYPLIFQRSLRIIYPWCGCCYRFCHTYMWLIEFITGSLSGDMLLGMGTIRCLTIALQGDSELIYFEAGTESKPCGVVKPVDCRLHHGHSWTYIVVINFSVFVIVRSVESREKQKQQPSMKKHQFVAVHLRG